MRALSVFRRRAGQRRVNRLQKLCIATRFPGFRLRGWFVAKGVARLTRDARGS
jgi:hypothetical protein